MSQIRPITPEEREIYSNIYEVVNGQSTVNLDEGTINIQTPVPQKDFEVCNIYNVSSEENSAILFHITNNSQENPGIGLNFILEQQFTMESVELSSLINNKLGVIVYNDYPHDFNQDNVNTIQEDIAEYGFEAISNLCENLIGNPSPGIKPLGDPKNGCGGVLIAQ
ncbi:hypothetical protein [Mesonia maritima]|uniref:Uncharacterized protein n=1 Tax=Mesonia maritima TaxID=1793873 RepID=A0ABU1K4R3_9FLAO|nr:hypothetical protein [Mesonia maritima]MDR6300579.1 hypothetical protein [Mesonia maritima]